MGEMAPPAAAVTAGKDDVVVKSPADPRSYRLVSLPNGLRALLVHDPEIYPDGYNPLSLPESEEDEDEDYETEGEDDEGDDADEDEEMEPCQDDEGECEVEGERKGKGNVDNPTKKAAAAMLVGMGSFSDPLKAQGLAHFLEHMLFMGSSEFPDENEYDSYLSKHGGSSNAFTETEYTCYYFEVSREYLKGALDRFSQFFISPLVKAEAMEREVLAVDSEFNQVLQSDNCRHMQLQCHTCFFEHPLNRFTWGNKKSLGDAMGNGVNLREEILRIYRDNYHGGMMRLVIIGGESLDVLESWVMERFSQVKPGPQFELAVKTQIPCWEGGKLYKLEAVKDVHVLHLSWPLPCLLKEYQKKPEDYLSHLMGHEGRGSILYLLKAKGWATTLSAGVGDDGLQRSSYAFIFVMSIHLTDAGLENIYEAISIVYQYIKLLRVRKPQEWIYKELQDIGSMEFRFAEELPQDDYAVDLAENMLYYEEKDIIRGEYIYDAWDPTLVESILNYFTPDNMRVDVVSKRFESNLEGIQHEPWFGAPYIKEDIESSWLQVWRNPPEMNISLHLPVKNEFIPSDFCLRSTGIQQSLNSSYPECIMDQQFMKMWYKIDSTFNVPRANAYFLVTVSNGYSSLRSCILIDLFVNLLKDELNEIIYQAGVAKLETSLSVSADKLELKLYGYNDKLSVLLYKILSLSQSFSPKADRFQVIKEDLERGYRNTNMKPLSHSSYLRVQMLRERFWHVDEKLRTLSTLTLDDLIAFVPDILTRVHIEGLCHGNLSKDEAINITKIFRDTLSSETLPKESRHKERIICLPPSAKFIKSVRVKNPLEINSVIELYFQIGQDIGDGATRLRAITDLFGCIIDEPCFDQLRTKEQLGYTVGCDPRMTYRVLGFYFRVQSSKYNPIYLHNRVENFISGLQKLLAKLSDESFEHHKKALIANKLEKDPSLAYETDRYWDQIVDKRYMFDMLKLEAEELQKIQKKDIVNFYKTYFRQSSPKCRRVAVHVWGCNFDITESAKMEKQSWKVVDDTESLKSSIEYYPNLC